ncbi:MAG: DMT family transporter [Clostridia bacterium]
MFAAPVLWSTAGVVTRHVQQAQAGELVFWRSLFAFASVFVFLLLNNKNPFSEMRKAGGPGLLSGALWAVMFTAFMVALTLTTTANTLVVMSLAPVFTAIAARVVLKESIAARTWIAVVACGAGIAWIAAGSGVEARGGRDLAGMLVALSVPIAAATNVIVLRAVARGERRIDLVPAVMLGGLISSAAALPLALPFQASGRDLALLGFLGFFQLALPCGLMVVAARVLPPAEVALIGLLEVVLGTLWAWLFAGEAPGAATLAGGALVLGALALNELAAPRSEAEEREARAADGG